MMNTMADSFSEKNLRIFICECKYDEHRVKQINIAIKVIFQKCQKRLPTYNVCDKNSI